MHNHLFGLQYSSERLGQVAVAKLLGQLLSDELTWYYEMNGFKQGTIMIFPWLFVVYIDDALDKVGFEIISDCCCAAILKHSDYHKG